MHNDDRLVVVKRCDGYETAEVDRAVEELFAALHAEELVGPGKRVAIKPNLLMRRRPDEATTTHPAVVAAVVKALRRRGVTDLLIAESHSGQYTKARLKSIYDGCGMTAMAEELKVALNLDLGVTQTSAPDARMCREFPILDPILQADVVVDVAKLKTHMMTTLSGCVKNLFGCVPGLLKPELHCRFPDQKDFAGMLIDLCDLVRPSLSICDGIVAMEGNGPSGGSPRQLSALIASRSPYAADVAACALIGLPPKQVAMLKEAMNRRLCPSSVEELTIEGDPIESLMQPDFQKAANQGTDFLMRVPKVFRGPVKALLTPKPHIRVKDCIGCGRCAESCPQHTIRIVDKKAVIAYSDCIKCYCCHEMCPVKAIDIRRFRLFDL